MFYIQRAAQPDQFRAQNGDWADARLAHGFTTLQALRMPTPPEGGVWVEADVRDHVLKRGYKPSTFAVPQLQADELQALHKLLSWAECQVCPHDETERRGAIWEYCLGCNAKWADDEGGKPEFKWPEDIVRARAVLDALKAKS